MSDQTKTQNQNTSMTQMGSWYLVTSPHTPEQCLQALDEIAEKGQEYTSMWRFGCKSGDHTGYAFFRAENQEQAISMVPRNMRHTAKVAKVDQLSVQQIHDLHNR